MIRKLLQSNYSANVYMIENKNNHNKHIQKQYKIYNSMNAELKALEACKSRNLDDYCVLSLYFDNNNKIIKFPYIEGGSLIDYIIKKESLFRNTSNRIFYKFKINIINRLCNILYALHENHIYHGDFRLENLVFENFAIEDEAIVGTDTIKCIDFGQSKVDLQENEIIQDKSCLGSYISHADEKFNGNHCYFYDRFELGITCLFILTGSGLGDNTSALLMKGQIEQAVDFYLQNDFDDNVKLLCVYLLCEEYSWHHIFDKLADIYNSF